MTAVEAQAVRLPEGVTNLVIPPRDKRGWSKGIVRWRFEGWWCLSVPFTWLLPEAADFCAYHDNCLVGGPAVRLMPEYIGKWAEVGDQDCDYALSLHNPNATVTTRGCQNRCPFCAVAKVEGPYRELAEWEAKPIVCDSNFLQCSDSHFTAVVESLRGVRDIDFNGGLEERYLTRERAEALLTLDLARVQLSWDMPQDEGNVLSAIDLLCGLGLKAQAITVRVLCGFCEEPEEALYRMTTLKALGVWPFAMRYQPLDCLRKNDYLPPQWKSRDLKWFVRYWNRQSWLEHVEFKWPSQAQPPLVMV